MFCSSWDFVSFSEDCGLSQPLGASPELETQGNQKGRLSSSKPPVLEPVVKEAKMRGWGAMCTGKVKTAMV